jgi:hypothetical protein
MEINVRFVIIFLSVFFASCAAPKLEPRDISELSIARFDSDNIETCRPADVDLDVHEAIEYFSRAKQVDIRVIHDQYNYAPCYIEGSLKYNGEDCDWQIRAGTTGHIRCYKKVKYFVCDTCNDLFENKNKE